MSSQKPQAQGPQGGQKAESGQPGSGSGVGRTDVTGIVPKGVHVDPNITEGHPGYQESGGSEIIPPRGSVQERPPEETPPG